jgi:bacillithiol biosynthesis deacetylase BshB1
VRDSRAGAKNNEGKHKKSRIQNSGVGIKENQKKNGLQHFIQAPEFCFTFDGLQGYRKRCAGVNCSLDRDASVRLNLNATSLKFSRGLMDRADIELDALAVFSHPDDAELSVAGTLLKLKAAGYRTGVLDMTRGEMGTRGTPEGRAEEAREAARIMKVDLRLNLEQPDGHVWLTEDARRAMVRVLRTHKPKVIFTPHWDDPHPDHAATSRIAREAARLASMRRYDEEFGLNSVQMPALAHVVYSRRVVPSFIVDVSDFVEEKMQAIRAHASQFYRVGADEPETRISDKNFLQQIEWRMRYYGSLIGAAAGEAYYVREALNIEDPVELLTRPMNIYS